MKNPQDIRYIKAFIIYVTLATIVGAVVGRLPALIIGFISGIVKAPTGTTWIVACAIFGFLLGTIASFFIFKWVIESFIMPQLKDSTGL